MERIGVLSKINTMVEKALGIHDACDSPDMGAYQYLRIPGTRPSFVQFLPWTNYNADTKVFEFDDNKSVGSAYLIKPFDAYGYSEKYLEQKKDAIDAALKSIPQHEDSPWVIQVYANDEPLQNIKDWLDGYVHERAKGSKHTQFYLGELEEHFDQLSKPGGAFFDSEAIWKTKLRAIRLCIYRKHNKGSIESATKEHHRIVNRFLHNLKSSGVEVQALDGDKMRYWMLPWLSPGASNGYNSPYEYMKASPYPVQEEKENQLPFGWDLATQCCIGRPETKPTEDGVSYSFNNQLSRYVCVSGIQSKPEYGHYTLESKSEGMSGTTSVAPIFERIPENTRFAATIVCISPEINKSHLRRLEKKSGGEESDADLTQEQIHYAREMIARGANLYKLQMGFYITGDDEGELVDKVNELSSHLTKNKLSIIDPAEDYMSATSFINQMPMAYDPNADKEFFRTDLTYTHHISRLMPFYGYSEGTGNPGFLWFNKIGSPLSIDPFSKSDRKKAAHGLLLGPTGAGKSVEGNRMTMHFMAFLKPRMVIIESGNSFGLTGDHMKRMGLKVCKYTMSPESKFGMNPFVDATKLDVGMTDDEIELSINATDDYLSQDNESNDEGSVKNEKRDLLGEMELSATLMITGGDKKEEEKITRAHRYLIRKAIIESVRKIIKSAQPNVPLKQMLPKDLLVTLKEFSANESSSRRRDAAEYMADCLSYVLAGFESKIFNKPSEPWEDADVTIIDLDVFARKGKEDMLAILMTALLNSCNNIGESTQHDGRPLIIMNDEAHVTTKNPLLGPYIATIGKMWRKLGVWLWLLTQNMSDFPGEAKKMLGMIEFWICLSLDEKEISDLKQFKNLTDEQISLLRNARKEPGKFVDGTLVSEKLTTSFRNIPPAIAIALAMTEDHEKNERGRIMHEHGISEVEAAYMMAENIKKQRELNRGNFNQGAHFS